MVRAVSAYTPGPWTTAFRAGAWIVYGRDQSAGSVAQIVAHNKTDEANAALIKEAPMMADLLRRLSDAAANSTCDSGVVDEARALLGRLPK